MTTSFNQSAPTSAGQPSQRLGVTAFVCVATLVLVVFGGLHLALSSPRWNWDVIGYVGCAHELIHDDLISAHRATYAAVDRDLPAARLRSDSEYRKSVSRDPVSFAQQLPFYRTRPLYNGAIVIAITSGLSPAWSTLWVASFAAALIVLAIFVWLRQYFSVSFAAVVCVLIFIATPISDTARSSSPDTLAALLIIAGLALANAPARRYSVVGIGLLTLSIGARPDALILVLPLLAALGLTKSSGVRMLDCAAAAIVAVLAYVAIQELSGWYGWSTLFHHTFTAALPYPADANPSVNWDSYVGQLVEGFHSRGRDRALGFGVLGIVLAWATRRASPRTTAIAIALVSNMALHYLLFPVWWKRFFLAQYTVLLTLAVVHSTLRLNLGVSRRKRSTLP